ncbi:MAG TPA: DUF4270 family protein [Cryomorphaceae bacterium]|nr:DUF4270 family protein [Cryomorphaceae bacterium]
MFYSDKRPRKLAAIFFLVALFSACEKPQESIGIDLQPESDILNVSGIDTFTVRSFTLPEDSLRTDGVTTGMAGAYIDPVFGFTKAAHYTEVRLTSSNPIFFTEGSSLENLVIDSLILNLAFEFGQGVPVYGSAGKQFFQVFEVVDSLDVTEPYYSNQSLSVLEEDLVLPGSNLLSPDYRDSSIVDGVAFRPSIRLPLNEDLGQRIFDASAGDGLSATEFLEVIKGLKITVDENASGVNLSNTGLISFNSFLGTSRMELYYRDTLVTDEDPEPDTLFYDFEIRGNTGKFNSFEHDFTRGGEPALVRQVVDGVASPGEQFLYVQAAGGVKLRVDLPYLENLRDKEGIAVAKAELILPVNGKSGGRYPEPVRLLLFGLDENDDAFLLDEFLQSPDYAVIDGSFDPANQRYRFFITRFVQQVLNGERDFHGLEIVVQGASTTANRVVINGAKFPNNENPEDNLRLEILFTNF